VQGPEFIPKKERKEKTNKRKGRKTGRERGREGEREKERKRERKKERKKMWQLFSGSVVAVTKGCPVGLLFWFCLWRLSQRRMYWEILSQMRSTVTDQVNQKARKGHRIVLCGVWMLRGSGELSAEILKSGGL
jgi:hypothetical protein